VLLSVWQGEGIACARWGRIRQRKRLCSTEGRARPRGAPAAHRRGEDIFLENFNPGTAGGSGFGYEAVRRIRPNNYLPDNA